MPREPAGDGYDAARTSLEHGRSLRWFSAVNEQSGGLLSRPTDELLNDVTVRNRQWYRFEANYDPTIALRGLKVPALFIFGDKDEVVPVEPSVAIIRRTQTDTGHRAFSIVVFPGADHVMTVPSVEGGRTFAAGYLATIGGLVAYERQPLERAAARRIGPDETETETETVH